MHFTQGKRTPPGNFKGFPIGLCFQLCGDIVDDLYRFFAEVESSSCQNKLDAY